MVKHLLVALYVITVLIFSATARAELSKGFDLTARNFPQGEGSGNF